MMSDHKDGDQLVFILFGIHCSSSFHPTTFRVARLLDSRMNWLAESTTLRDNRGVLASWYQDSRRNKLMRDSVPYGDKYEVECLQSAQKSISVGLYQVRDQEDRSIHDVDSEVREASIQPAAD
jgi:hypothetical protein